MKKILMFIVVSVLATNVAMAGSFTIEGAELSPIQEKRFQLLLKNGGVDPEKADIEIVISHSDELSLEIGEEMIVADVTILVDDKILQGRSINTKKNMLIALERAMKHALK